MDVDKNVTQLSNTSAEVSISVKGKGAIGASCHTPSDVVLVTDLSNSMAWPFNGMGVCEENCSDSGSITCPSCLNNNYCNDTSSEQKNAKYEVTKYGQKVFKDIILSHGDRAGLVDYDYGARTNPSNLTTNDTELSERIDNYTAYGCRTGGWNFATTNSCGALNKSIEMLLNSADKNKAIIFMSGGAPTHKCDELYSNSRLVEEYVNATAQNPDFYGETLMSTKFIIFWRWFDVLRI